MTRDEAIADLTSRLDYFEGDLFANPDDSIVFVTVTQARLLLQTGEDQ